MVIIKDKIKAKPLGDTLMTKYTPNYLLGLFCFLLALSATPATAQAADEWDVKLGAGAIYKAEYKGSDEYETIALPYIDVEYNKRFFLNPQQGLGVYALRNRSYTLGASVGYEFGRDEDDDARLRGLGDVDATAELGLFGSIAFAPFELKGEIRQDILDGHDGMTAEAGIDYKTDWSKTTFLSLGPSITWASDNYMESYFGVSNAQAANSAFNTYKAEAGIAEYGFGGTLIHMLDQNWFVTVIGEYSKLAGDAKDSPITEEDNQFFSGAFIGYKF